MLVTSINFSRIDPHLFIFSICLRPTHLAITVRGTHPYIEGLPDTVIARAMSLSRSRILHSGARSECGGASARNGDRGSRVMREIMDDQGHGDS